MSLKNKKENPEPNSKHSKEKVNMMEIVEDCYFYNLQTQ